MKAKAVKTKRKVTLDDLAAMTANGFDGLRKEMSERFEQVDKRFEQVDKRFEQVDKRFDGIEKRLVSVEEGQSSLVQEVIALNRAQDETNRRLTSIERKQTGILSSLDETVTRSEFRLLANKVAVLEKKK